MLNEPVVLSIRDISYPLTPNTAFHPFVMKGAIPRICSDFKSMVRFTSSSFQDKLVMILNNFLNNPKIKHVWAAVVEYRGQPLYIIRNLAHTNTTLPYRRVLLLNLDPYLWN